MTTQLPNGYEAVTVPDEEWVLYINYYWVGKSNNEFWLCATAGQLDVDIQKLDQSYVILGRADELTEEQVKDVVESYTQTVGWRSYDKGEELPTITAYMNYGIRKPVPVTFLFFTALESFRSLLASLHLEPHTTIILKKENV